MSSSTRGSADPPRKPLPVEIHAATRSYHTSLNRLITTRLPLCLPPHASDASTYSGGVSAFAEIYFTFESEWTSIISSPTTTDTSPRVQTLLGTLYHSPLLRAAKLNHDLSILSPHHTNHERLLALTSLTSPITTRIQSQPHILLAYTWIMYLAIFNGGRWIRSQLLSTTCTSPFWPNGVSPEDCLTFWHFDGDQDGEDIKDDFKARYEVAAAQLTEMERQDVVEEAVEIFKLCARIVEDLDLAFAAKEEKERSPALTLMNLPLFSALTSQLYGILVWTWALVLAPLSKA